MFDAITTAGITTQATAMATEFGDAALVAIGIGVAFAATRFIVGLFY